MNRLLIALLTAFAFAAQSLPAAAVEAASQPGSVSGKTIEAIDAAVAGDKAVKKEEAPKVDKADKAAAKVEKKEEKKAAKTERKAKKLTEKKNKGKKHAKKSGKGKKHAYGKSKQKKSAGAHAAVTSKQ